MSAYGSTSARRRVIEGVLALTPELPMEEIEDLLVYRRACLQDQFMTLGLQIRDQLSPAIRRVADQIGSFYERHNLVPPSEPSTDD